MDVTSYLLGKKAGGGTPINNQNKDITITENGTTTVSADAGYTGLGTVGVTTNVQPDLESKSVTITENGTTTVIPTAGKDGLSEVEVTTNVPTSGPDLSEYFDDTITSGSASVGGWRFVAKKLPSPLKATNNTLRYAFVNYKESTIPKITGTSNVTNMTGTFSACEYIVSLDLSDWDTSNVTKFPFMFEGCRKLKNLNISSFDFSSCQQINGMFTNDDALENLSFGYNLGKGYLTTASANYNYYALELDQSNNLTHDSLMSVINGLYDIASAGVQPQQLVLGSTNLAKLSQAEKDMVTAKGWNLS